MRSIFLADAHLKGAGDDNYKMLLSFLRDLEGQVDTLYIMGDLFDFWLGFPSNPFRQFDSLLESLERLVTAGCRLVYLEGNHDFHLGDVFTKRLRAEVLTGPVTVTVQGKRLYLCHGDQINREDRNYRILRFILRSRIVGASVSCFPPVWALAIKERLQRRSQASYHVKSSRWNYREILRDFACQLQQQEVDGMVTGHFHIALQETLAGRPFILLSLGDWMEQYTYGEMLDGELRLMSYSPKNVI